MADALLNDLIVRYPMLEVCRDDIMQAFSLIRDSYKSGGKLLICGNGGSAADCEHIVGELMKSFMLTREIPAGDKSKIKSVSPQNGEYIIANLQGALPAISLVSQSALISAYSNDVAPDMVFAQQVYGYGRPKDAFLGISTSGNSKNIVYASEMAKAMGISTIALTGESGGVLKDICHTTICAPSDVTPSIQDYHLPIYHTLCMMLEEEFFRHV